MDLPFTDFSLRTMQEAVMVSVPKKKQASSADFPSFLKYRAVIQAKGSSVWWAQEYDGCQKHNSSDLLKSVVSATPSMNIGESPSSGGSWISKLNPKLRQTANTKSSELRQTKLS